MQNVRTVFPKMETDASVTVVQGHVDIRSLPELLAAVPEINQSNLLAVPKDWLVKKEAVLISTTEIGSDDYLFDSREERPERLQLAVSVRRATGQVNSISGKLG